MTINLNFRPTQANNSGVRLLATIISSAQRHFCNVINVLLYHMNTDMRLLLEEYDSGMNVNVRTYTEPMNKKQYGSGFGG